MADLIVEHVSEHPDRDDLDGIGGVPLSDIRLVYAQYVKPDSPSTQGLPRIYSGVTYNGGTPWSDTFDRSLMLDACSDTQTRVASATGTSDPNNIVLDFEPQWLSDITSLSSSQFAEGMRCLYDCSVRFGGLWGIPHWDWLPTEAQFEFLRRVFSGQTNIHYDAYWYYTWSTAQYEQALSSLASRNFLLSKASTEAIIYVRPVLNADVLGTALTVDQWRAMLTAIRDNGFRRVCIWHDGNADSGPSSPATIGAGGFNATKAICAQSEIASVIAEFT